MTAAFTKSTIAAILALSIAGAIAPSLAAETEQQSEVTTVVQDWIAKQQEAFNRAVEAKIPAAISLVDDWVMPIVFGTLPKTASIVTDTGFIR